jgi:hypothetical protein
MPASYVGTDSIPLMWRRALVLLVISMFGAASCGGNTLKPAPSSSRSTGASPTAVSPSASSSPSTPSSIEPVDVPEGTPASYAHDVDAADLPAEALVPTGTTPTDIWPAIAPDGTQFALVAFAAPSDDPLRRARGLVVWRRFPDPPLWRPAYGLSDPADAGVLEIHTLIGDATADGSPDALTFEDTGGSGACGTWRVLDLASNAQVYESQTCDATYDVSIDPAGIVLRAAVYRPGDAHCCPSATRTTVFVYGGDGRWTIVSRVVTPNA